MKRAMYAACAGFLLSAACALADPPVPAVPAPAAPAAPKDDEKEGTIAGIPIQRGDGGWIGVELKDESFVITFYNAKKKPIPADVGSAVLWWPVHYQPNPERTELSSSDNPAVLTSSYSVKPPYAFKLHISLLADGKDPEVYVIDFSA
jgi:hypothetical protein